MSIEEIALEAEERMEKSLALLSDQLRGVRTGRASVGLVESIRVDYYGSPTPLKQLANLSTPEPQQILIRPFDQTVLGDIVKAIQASDIGLTPNSDNKVIRLNVPSLSVEQRKKLVSRVKDLSEEARIAIRNIRRDANKQADQEQADKILTEDDLETCKEETQSLTKRFESKVNEMAEKKSTEILDV
ncbi:ribosome recycling factor [Singulisphaera acidiphila]|uniref:Ribosome-recycling factor n=1 Tax=Singulisphaera acidiphila (strain ATCC BAA-1392 / DSM 18658 / VKM B-2454 / MOB10) TaxID=886293 RepID=L0DLJ8_SINAD|nr:ribosome recycling factor [Singulisphaera acidiphila]AGA29718.1 ribosome recycling factor [Singulisphaera acidiphila DSM 18658]